MSKVKPEGPLPSNLSLLQEDCAILVSTIEPLIEVLLTIYKTELASSIYIPLLAP